MNKRPDFTDPWEAARVSSFMEADSRGRWEILPFTKTQETYDRERLLLTIDGGEHNQLRLDRLVPPGDFVCLRRDATPTEIEDAKSGDVFDGADLSVHERPMMPVMSDTPAEIDGHREVIEKAHGNVLITGLGLGCIVSALLAKPVVDTITVVEIDRDVMALTWPYYDADPRTRIVTGDALGMGRLRLQDPNGRFDYAWHDVWTHISSRNLDNDQTAEHGISYKSMFEAYAPFCDEQGAWAYHDALHMQEVTRRKQEEEDAFAERFLAASVDDRTEMLFDQLVRSKLRVASSTGHGLLPPDEPIPDELRAMFAKTGLLDHCREAAEDFDQDAFNKWRNQPDNDTPLGHPNRVEGANVAAH